MKAVRVYFALNLVLRRSKPTYRRVLRYAELHSMEGVQQSVFVQSKYTVEVRKCRAVYQGPACWQERVVSLSESGV